MLKTMKSIAILAVVFGLATGCSSNKPTEDTTAAIEPTETVESGLGVGDTGVDVVEEDPLADLATTFYFEFDSAVLKPEARAALTAYAEYFSNTPSTVRLEGHADERGSREYNMALGERRANAVRDYLILQGVSRSSIETVSYGEERPSEVGSNEYSWSKNRRVELQYQ